MVSVIIPAYNVEKTIQHCLQSLIAQDYQNLEIIVIDDGSIDNTFSLCKKLEDIDNRIKIIHQKNQGVSTARNNGLQYCKGEWISFVDADDYVDPNFISSLVEKTLNTDFVISNIYIHSQKQNSEAKVFNQKITNHSQDKIAKLYPILNLYYLGGPWGKLFKKELLTKNNITFDPTIHFGEDSLFVYKYLATIDNVGIALHTHYHYNAGNNGSLSSNAESDSILRKYLKDYEMAQLCCKKWNIEAKNLELYYLNGILEALSKSYIDHKITDREPYYKLIYKSPHRKLVQSQLPFYFDLLGRLEAWTIYSKIMQFHYT